MTTAAPPRISVVTPSFNQARFVRRTIESVLEQGIEELEHIVVDGGSTDGTVEILKQYPQLRWVSEPDRGQSDALNKGIALARGEWICWINSDDYLLPGALRRFMDFLRDHPQAEFVYSDCVFVDEEGATTGRRKARFSQQALYYWWRYGSGFGQPGSLFTKRLWQECGGFDVGLRYTMDYDFWLKAHDRVPFHYLEGELATYRLHAASKTGEGWRPFAEEKARVEQRYWDAKGGWRKWEFRFRLPLMLATQLVIEGHRQWSAGDRRAAWRCWREAWGRQPLALLSRPHVVFAARQALGLDRRTGPANVSRTVN